MLKYHSHKIMQKVSKNLFVFSICILILLACFLVLPEEQAFAYSEEGNCEVFAESTSFGDFDVENYDVTIDAKLGRRATVTEVLTINFYNSCHGIFRDLNMANGEDYSHIDVVGAPMQLSKHNEYIRLRLGDPDVYYHNGDVKIFKITYDVVMPKYNESKDSFLYNVIPYGFDEPIRSFDVKVILPLNDFDLVLNENFFLHTGYMGSSSTDVASYKLNGNVLEITSKPGEYLSANNGVGIRINFPKGTLANVVNLEPLYIFLAGLVILALAIVMLFVYGRDDKIVEVIRFDPPFKMPPIDVGYLIDGRLENSDITSLFFYWAKLGAIEIHEEKKKIWFVKTGELPEYCRSYEKELFDSLFLGRDIVDPTQLNEAFILKVQKTKLKISKQYSKNMYTKQSVNVSHIFMVLAILFVTITSIVADKFKYGTWDVSIAFLGIIIGVIIFGYYSLGKYLMEKILKMGESKKKTWSFIGYGLLGIVIAVACMYLLSFMRKFTLIKSFCMIICPVITCWIAPYIHKRTDEYNSILGEILGFRNFILVAKKDQLEALVKENPSYYYDILPYAHVLGVSDVLEKKFKDIKLDLPFWYRGSNVDIFDIYILNSLTRDITASIATQVASAAAKGVGATVSKFGGGSSGGGFSGGGFGGGGGGSW